MICNDHLLNKSIKFLDKTNRHFSKATLRKKQLFKINASSTYQSKRLESNKSLNWLIQPKREKDESSSNVINFERKKSILKTTSKGSYYHEKVVLGYSRELMCDLVYDVQKYKEFLPFCINSELIDERETKSNKINLKIFTNKDTQKIISPKYELKQSSSLKAKLEIGYPPIKESYVSHVSMIRPQLVKAISRDTKLFEYLINEWKFHPYTFSSEFNNANKDLKITKQVIDNCCIVEFYVSFKFRSPLYTKFSDLFMDQIYKRVLTAFTKRALTLYGKPVIETKNLT